MTVQIQRHRRRTSRVAGSNPQWGSILAGTSMSERTCQSTNQGAGGPAPMRPLTLPSPSGERRVQRGVHARRIILRGGVCAALWLVAVLFLLRLHLPHHRHLHLQRGRVRPQAHTPSSNRKLTMPAQLSHVHRLLQSWERMCSLSDFPRLLCMSGANNGIAR